MEIKAYVSEELDNPSAALSTISKITKRIRVLKTHAVAGASISSIADVDDNY